MHTLRKSPLLAALGFLWVLGILGLYYVSHKPFTPELAVQVVSRAWELAAVGLLTALAGGLGWRLAPRLPLPPLAALSLQAALGFGLLALGVLAVGQIPGVLRWALWAALPVGGWLLRRDLRAWLAQAAGVKALWRRSDGCSRAVRARVRRVRERVMLEAPMNNQGNCTLFPTRGGWETFPRRGIFSRLEG
ncbi:hypothetical protein [Levilinea saccharolytica]|uniref:Uncharacterized protein n=1 Tax=Levilinea saccharolytica TaxID=229921 RepID=A0A0P6XCT6_9CHLR|nr:hypothetical protein [Levilinea saccharolytica]KPL80425.1 hypothetical protein ADN01_12190 [Levilinea saccharolytica]